MFKVFNIKYFALEKQILDNYYYSHIQYQSKMDNMPYYFT
jgi:hypothetical protein